MQDDGKNKHSGHIGQSYQVMTEADLEAVGNLPMSDQAARLKSQMAQILSPVQFELLASMDQLQDHLNTVCHWLVELERLSVAGLMVMSPQLSPAEAQYHTALAIYDARTRAEQEGGQA